MFGKQPAVLVTSRGKNQVPRGGSVSQCQERHQLMQTPHLPQGRLRDQALQAGSTG